MIVGSRESKERTVKFYRLALTGDFTFYPSHTRERARVQFCLGRRERRILPMRDDVEYLHLTIDVEHRGEEREIVVRGRTRVDGGDTEP